jgi:hypothetical protein
MGASNWQDDDEGDDHGGFGPCSLGPALGRVVVGLWSGRYPAGRMLSCDAGLSETLNPKSVSSGGRRHLSSGDSPCLQPAGKHTSARAGA